MTTLESGSLPNRTTAGFRQKVKALFTPGSETDWPDKLCRWTFIILGLGIIWRLTRYLLCMPVWGDEAFIVLNLMDRNFRTILEPLDYGQVAPAIFLWGEMAMLKFVGGSEYAMRFLPLLAGIAAIFLFWRWSRLLFSDATVPLAVGFYALGYYTVRHSVEIKPYAGDQLAATSLLLVATLWMRQPERWRYGCLLAAIIPVAMGASYPSVFLAGGIMLALGVALLPRRDARLWVIWAVCGVAVLGTFVLLYANVGSGQYNKTGEMMREYWKDSFPPFAPFELIKWLLDVHTGNMLAYPMGGKKGGSTATLLLCLVGIAWLVRNRGWDWRVLLFAPFALTFIAAAIHRYPYGGSARVSQHLAPAICVLAAAGLFSLIKKWTRNNRGQQRAVIVTFCIYIVITIGGIARDFRKPFHGRADEEVRVLIHQILEKQNPSSPVVVLQPVQTVPVNQQYYLRLAGPRVHWNGMIDTAWQQAAKDGVTILNFDASVDPVSGTASESLRPFMSKWIVGDQRVVSIKIGPFDPPYWQITTLKPR